jgi:hypothetical protein
MKPHNFCIVRAGVVVGNFTHHEIKSALRSFKLKSSDKAKSPISNRWIKLSTLIRILRDRRLQCKITTDANTESVVLHGDFISMSGGLPRTFDYKYLYQVCKGCGYTEGTTELTSRPYLCCQQCGSRRFEGAKDRSEFGHSILSPRSYMVYCKHCKFYLPRKYVNKLHDRQCPGCGNELNPDCHF